MTTQVMIATNLGVAVASDSFLTLMVDGDAKSRKAIPNSRKIHEIGGKHKVLVTSAGNAELNGLPIELYIIRWAESLSEPLPTTRDYQDSFVSWLAGNVGDSEVLRDRVTEFLDELAEGIFNDSSRLENPLLEDLPNLYSVEFEAWYQESEERRIAFSALRDQIIEGEIAELEYSSKSEYLDLKGASRILYEQLNPDWYKSYFSPSVLDARAISLLAAAAPAYAISRQPESESTKLSFVGYGTSNFTPTIDNLILEGAEIGAALAFVDDVAIRDIHDCVVFYPIQNTAIRTFFDGIDPIISDFKIRTFIQNALASLQEKDYGGVKIPMHWEFIWDLTNSLTEQIDEYGASKNGNLLKTLGAMDLVSVAEVAQSLVGIEVLNAHTSLGSPHSGGIIEVATIDLQNGVIWHNRIPAQRK